MNTESVDSFLSSPSDTDQRFYPARACEKHSYGSHAEDISNVFRMAISFLLVHVVSDALGDLL